MTDTTALSLTLLLGGVRAGKSARALQLARVRCGSEPTGNVLFVATAQAFDSEMEQRIQAHRNERPETWTTLEEPLDLAGAIDRLLVYEPTKRVIVIDCMTLWVSNLLLAHPELGNIEQLVGDETRQLLHTMQTHSLTASESGEVPREWIIVSNEVGLGIVPPTPLGRQYRDALGRANQLLAAAANEVTLLVAGLELPLKNTRPV